MATIATGYTFADGQTATPVRLNELAGSATITFSTGADTDNSTLEVSGNAFRVKDGGITAAKAATGFVVDVQVGRNTTYSSVTATTPALDDTVPLVSEGTQINTATITPKATSNNVLVVASGALTASTATNAVVAVFRGSTCIAAAYVSQYTANASAQYHVEVLDSPAVSTATTYTVRAGVVSGGTLYVNGNTSGRRFGGVQGQTLTLMEIRA